MRRLFFLFSLLSLCVLLPCSLSLAQETFFVPESAVYAAPPPVPAPAPDVSISYGIVCNDSSDEELPLLETADKGGNVLAMFPNGTTVLLLPPDAEGSAFVRVQIGDSTGYMASAHVQHCPITPPLAPLTSGVTKLATYALIHPLANTTSLFFLEEGAPVRILARAGCWYQVMGDEEIGYVLTNTIAVDTPAGLSPGAVGIVDNPSYHDRLIIRSEPEKESVALYRLFNGEQIKIESAASEEYYEVIA